MGGIDSWFDDLDERQVSLDGYRQPNIVNSYGNYNSPSLFMICVYDIFIFICFIYFKRFFFTIMFDDIYLKVQYQLVITPPFQLYIDYELFFSHLLSSEKKDVNMNCKTKTNILIHRLK